MRGFEALSELTVGVAATVAATADEVVVKMALATEVDSRVAEEDSNKNLRIELCTCRAERGLRLRAPRRCSILHATWSR